MAAGNFEIHGKALVILITRLVEYRFKRGENIEIGA
jgi:hypothetical protein